MAFDIYPEYRKEANQIANFLTESMESANSLFKDDWMKTMEPYFSKC